MRDCDREPFDAQGPDSTHGPFNVLDVEGHVTRTPGDCLEGRIVHGRAQAVGHWMTNYAIQFQWRGM